MNILHIIYSLAPGGAERFVVDLCNELAVTDNKVTLCTLRDSTDSYLGFYKFLISTDVNFINYPYKEGFRLRIFFELSKLIKRIKPDVIHCHLGTVLYLMPLSIIYSNINFYYTVHSDASKEAKYKMEKRIRYFFFKKNIVKAITISNETSKSFICYYNLKNYIQINNGRSKDLPTKLYGKVKKEISKLKNDYKTVFLHVARCNSIKNQNLLIDSFNELIRRKKDVILLIIGDGYESEEGKKLQSKALNGIYFLGSKNNVVDYYLNADAFCLTSNYEGLPISLIEAISHGCIPICTPVGGIPNVIQNGVTGYLANDNSKESYIHVLEKFLCNKHIIKKEYLIQYYEQKYNINICGKKYLEIYRNDKIVNKDS